MTAYRQTLSSEIIFSGKQEVVSVCVIELGCCEWFPTSYYLGSCTSDAVNGLLLFTVHTILQNSP